MKSKLLIPSIVLTTATATIPMATVGCVWTDSPEVVPTKITLDVSSCSLEVGKTRQLHASIEPKNLTPKLIWKTSDRTKVTVSSTGLITAKAKTGMPVTIMVYPEGYESKVYATCSVTVMDNQPTGVRINGEHEISIYQGSGTTILSAQVFPEGASQNVDWKVTSGNNLIWTSPVPFSNKYNVTANPFGSTGDATIQVNPQGYPSLVDTITIHVVTAPPERIDFFDCDWTELSYLCEQLENKDISEEEFCNEFQILDLSTPYPYETKYPTSLKDFIGQPHEIYYPGESWGGGEGFATVIGINQDYQQYNSTTGEFSQPVTFTFEMYELIGSEESDTGAFQWDAKLPSKDGPRYFSTSLYRNLTLGEINNTFQEDSDFYDAVRPIYKTSAYWDRTKSRYVREVSKQNNRFFLLNISDIFSFESIRKTFDSEACDGYRLENIRSSFPTIKNYQYDYYANAIADGSLLDSQGDPIPYDCLYHDPRFVSDDDSFNYWIASANLTDETTINDIWSLQGSNVNYDGTLDSQNIMSWFYVAPCFCI